MKHDDCGSWFLAHSKTQYVRNCLMISFTYSHIELKLELTADNQELWSWFIALKSRFSFIFYTYTFYILLTIVLQKN